MKIKYFKAESSAWTGNVRFSYKVEGGGEYGYLNAPIVLIIDLLVSLRDRYPDAEWEEDVSLLTKQF